MHEKAKERQAVALTQMVLEYLSPQKAYEFLARFNTSLPKEPEAQRETLSRVYRMLHGLNDIICSHVVSLASQ